MNKLQLIFATEQIVFGPLLSTLVKHPNSAEGRLPFHFSRTPSVHDSAASVNIALKDESLPEETQSFHTEVREFLKANRSDAGSTQIKIHPAELVRNQLVRNPGPRFLKFLNSH